MKNKKDKFRNNALVKPLYRKVKPKNVLVSVHRAYSLDGDDLKVDKVISDVAIDSQLKRFGKKQGTVLPACGSSKTVISKVYSLRDNRLGFKMVDSDNNKSNAVHSNTDNQDKLIQAEEHINVSDTWLRVYPLPQQQKESVCSTIVRCIVCQFGLASLLIIWTVLWVFVIHSFEGPYEMKVAQDFDSEQNQLVIDLATELRQITPISPKWRDAIEKRIQQERQLTILAVGKGARAHPGQFWDLPGTFLFTIYVMTALGFGAPVPQTVWGRSAAMVYALIAVSTHIYLMVNASTCIIAKCSSCHFPLKGKHRKRKSYLEDKNYRESPNYSRNSDVLKTSRCSNTRRKILRCLSVVCACHCVPIAAILYYVCGALCFGVLRSRGTVEAIMFPLEFTTTGGLESVLGHIRILYGFYVEGAMMLLSCGLATVRRRSNAAVNSIAHKYRLFQVDA